MTFVSFSKNFARYLLARVRDTLPAEPVIVSEQNFLPLEFLSAVVYPLSNSPNVRLALFPLLSYVFVNQSLYFLWFSLCFFHFRF